jgi:signal transduction histidine kinase/CheY-like chemotaxis protein
MPSPATIASLDDLGDRCPVSGLPVTRDPHWCYQNAATQYSQRFALIGERILLSEPEGVVGLEDAPQVLGQMQQVMQTRLGRATTYVHLANFSRTKSATGEVRKYFVRHFQENQQVAGVVYFKVSPFFRISIKLACRLNLIPFNVHIADSYAEAVRWAMDLLGLAPPADEAQDEAIHADAPLSPQNDTTDAPRYRKHLDGTMTVAFERPAPDVFQVAVEGIMEAHHIAALFEHYEKAFTACGLPDGDYYFVGGAQHLKSVSLRARRLYFNHIREWHARHPFRAYIFYGVNRMIRAAINVARHFVPFEVLIVADREAALAAARDHRRSGLRTGRPSPAVHAPHVSGYVEELLAYLGRIGWEADGRPPPPPVEAAHPFRPVFEAINLIKGDFDELLHDRDAAAESLRQRTEFVEVVTESLPVGLCVSRMDDNRLVYANARFSVISGWDSDRLPLFSDFVDQAFRRAALREEIQQLAAEAARGHNARREWDGLELTTPAGLTRHVTLKVGVIPEQALMIATLTDVSERVRMTADREKLQAQLHQSQKMEAVGTLAGGIAHDFNNILAAIMGYVEMALLDLPVSNPVRQNLDQVLKASHRARELVKQILAFSRKNAGERKALALNRLVEETVGLMRATLPASVAIDTALPSDSGLVMADATQIHQVLINLCTNAAQAMEGRGGMLRIAVDAVRLDVPAAGALEDIEPGDYVKLEVADSGPGIPAEILPRIFDPFFTTKAPGEGTGMGLSVVHGIVRSHQGAIRVTSRLGEGTEFTIFLPQARRSDDSPRTRAAQLPLGREHVLFIDDEVMLADIGCQMLERLGYRVTMRTSSVEALEAFRAQPNSFDMVISDLTMPNLTGDRLASHLLAIRDDIPIVLCTGFSSLMNEERAAALGVRALLSKPLSMEEMAHKIRGVLDGTKS